MKFKIDDFGKWKRADTTSKSFFWLSIRLHHIFDGDHAPLNGYAVRSKMTIQDVMDTYDELRRISEKERGFESEAKALIKKAQSEDVMINLRNISREMFASGEIYREFMRTVMKLQELNGGNNND
jgi:hypothetical protein